MADNKTPDQKPAAEQPITMKQVIDLIPTMIASAVAAASKPVVAAAKPSGAPAPKCTECRQVKDNGFGGGCQGKHTLMVVYPQKYPQHADYFPGAIINGVRYLSNDGGHKVLVPDEAVGTIEAIVAAFEQNEQDMAVGRVKEHHSGRMGPSGSSVNPASAAWR